MTDFGPCSDWPVQWMCDLTESAAVTGSALTGATEILWALSGRQFGTCEITLRPCRRDCDIAAGWQPWPGTTYPVPALIGGQWYNLVCGCTAAGCSCTTLVGREVVLPAQVSSITVVKIDGSPMATGSYRVDDNRILVRTDGSEWPSCNDLTKSDTEAGTWSVTAAYGQPVPTMGKLAVGELACEIVRALRGDDCRLPRHVQSLVRQGVTIQFPQITELLKDGKTGLYLTDMFLAAVNPAGLPARPRTFSVDTPAHRRAGT